MEALIELQDSVALHFMPDRERDQRGQHLQEQWRRRQQQREQRGQRQRQRPRMKTGPLQATTQRSGGPHLTRQGYLPPAVENSAEAASRDYTHAKQRVAFLPMPGSAEGSAMVRCRSITRRPKHYKI